ncbi:acyltransferase family protein [Alteromonadaceae bacterium BrNp21-10]|nr:acyltransferase family protein [Alteromonadaceae bacterium BrNp21-10]
MQYRFDIDGLRAIAIIAILIFHIDPRFAGGYIGVDIFFVISGFLITGIIWRDIEKNTFSFQLFYLKRIRRLFPALFGTLLLSFIFVIFFGLNSEIEMFGKSTLSSLFYISNVFFYTQNDYFDSDLELNPLLHTWSLSVEEQFYLIFPIFLFWLFKRKTNSFFYLSVFFLLSLALSEYLVHLDKSAAFFLSPSRFWQFLTGSFIAIYFTRKKLTPFVCETLSILGLAALTISLLTISEITPFPGLNALLPTAGTALLIIGGINNSTWTYKALASPVPKFLGNISYSLYLWHWPIIVFYKISISPSLISHDKVIIFCLAILAGYLSWKLIEQPTAKISVSNKKGQLLGYSMLSIAALSVVSVLAISTSSFKSSDQAHIESYLNYKMKARIGTCFLTSGYDDVSFFNEEECIKTGETKNVLLIGDSHAAQYYSALKSLYPTFNISQINASGCRPVVEFTDVKYCRRLMEKAFTTYIPGNDFDIILIAGRWLANDIIPLEKTIHYFDNSTSQIMILGPVIEYNQPLPMLLARFGSSAVGEKPQITIARQWDERTSINDQIKQITNGTSVQFASIIDAMCSNETCITITKEGVPIQSDQSHLTEEGATLLLRRIFDDNLELR